MKHNLKQSPVIKNIYLCYVFLIYIGIILLTTFLIPQVHATDYIHEGDQKIADDLHSLETFISYYKQNNSNFSSLEKMQIESQYESISQSLNFIKSKIDKKSNIEVNYNAIDTGIYLHEAKLPILYSEVFAAKAAGFGREEQSILTNNVSTLIFTFPENKKIEGTGIQMKLIHDQQAAALELNKINDDYFSINQIQSNEANTVNIRNEFRVKVKNLKDHQQEIVKQTEDFTQNFQIFLDLKS